MSFIQKNPKWVFSILGAILIMIGLIPSLFISDRYVKHVETQNLELKQKYEKLQIEKRSVEVSLVEVKEKLKKKTMTYKIIRADGTIEERTSSEIDSESMISEQVQKEFKEKIQKELVEQEQKFNKKLTEITKESKKLSVEVGINTKYIKYLHFNYQFLPPFSAGFYVDDSNTYAVGIGMSF